MLQGFFGLINGKPWEPIYKTGQNRVRMYSRWMRLYEGYAARLNVSGNLQYKMLRYNPCIPIINIKAEFLASNPISFQVEGDSGLSQVANEIWTRSKGTETFMENALFGSIIGDAVLTIDYNDDNQVIVKWVDPSSVYPYFNPLDYEHMENLTVAFGYIQDDGSTGNYMEEWKDGTISRYDGVRNAMVPIGTWDQAKFEGLPWVWIRNQAVKGYAFGKSDVQPIAELVEEYDHLMTKLSSAVDYYAQPNIIVKGVRSPAQLQKNTKSMYFLPSDGDMQFLEWQGAGPGILEQIEQIRNELCELTGAPKVSFSNFDFKSSDISGVAMKLMFGPLLKSNERKQLTYGLGIRKAMRMALVEETGKKIPLSQISVLWPSPLPDNTKEDWEIGVMKDLLGVSRAQIQREQGYTQDQIDQMKLEAQAEKKQAADEAAYAAAALAAAVAPYQTAPVGDGEGNSKSAKGSTRQPSGKAQAQAMPKGSASLKQTGQVQEASNQEKADHVAGITKSSIIGLAGVTGKSGVV